MRLIVPHSRSIIPHWAKLPRIVMRFLLRGDMKIVGRVGQRFGDYRLIRFLGAGTFGDVYLGEQVYDKTPTAVKVFKAKLTPDKFKDFLNEVRTVLLRHPNIVQVLDFGLGEDDVPFLVMEFAPNGTLLQYHPSGTHLPLP